MGSVKEDGNYFNSTLNPSRGYASTKAPWLYKEVMTDDKEA